MGAAGRAGAPYDVKEKVIYTFIRHSLRQKTEIKAEDRITYRDRVIPYYTKLTYTITLKTNECK